MELKNTGYWNKDSVFYCMKWLVLKLQCGVFVLHCVTKLLFAFIRALTSLSLSDNGIGAGGAKAIAAALPQS